MFYRRDASGIPAEWLQRVRASMSRLTAQFSANRVVREYTESHYLPRAKAYCERTKNSGAAMAGLIRWRQEVEEHWPRLRFGGCDVSTNNGQHVFRAQVYLDELDSDSIRVELLAEAGAGHAAEVVPMTRGEALVGASNARQYVATVPASRPAADFTARIVPHHPLVSVPLECPHILWCR